MTVTLATPIRTLAVNEVISTLNNGSLTLLTAADVVVAVLPLSAIAFQNAVDGVSTANPITPDTNTGAGTVTKFQLRNNFSTPLIFGSVSLPAGGGDLEMANNVFLAGDTASCEALTYTHPA